MVHTVNTHEAKTTLSRLLAEVEAGGEVVIARAGKPIARLVPANEPVQGVQFATARGQIWYAPDWDAPMTEEELAEFERPLIGMPE